MIFKNGKEISAVYIGQKAIQAVYHGAVLVWQAVRSCFGSGVWIEDKPWLDDEAWKEE